MKQINELLLNQPSRHPPQSTDMLALQSSILEKNDRIFQKYKANKQKLNTSNSSLFFQPLISNPDSMSNPSNSKLFQSMHIKYNNSLMSLKEMTLPLVNKSKKTPDNNNIYSMNSRLKEIHILQIENKFLKQQLLGKKIELEDIDQFKIAMNNVNFDSTANFNEKRVNCLKGQIIKQQKYIKKLEKTFKLMKIFYEDSKSFMSLFIELSSKNQEKNKAKSRNKFPANIEETLQRMDSDVFKQSVDKLMKNFKNPDLLKDFMENFNNAYKNILTCERSNEEFQGLFKKTRTNEKNQKNPLEYQNPITVFVEKYKKFFNIKTVLDVIEPMETERITVNFENLLTLSKKVESLFNKLNSIDIFRNNDFYIDSNQFLSEENHVNFVEFLSKNSQTHFLTLKYQEIMNLESRLANLLNELIHFEYDLIYQKEEINLIKLSNLQEKLRNNIEKLIELGVRLSDTEDANLLYILEKNTKHERETTREKNDLIVMIGKNSEEIKRDFKNCCIYIKEFMVNLPESVVNDETQQKKIKKIDFLIDVLIAIFEQKDVFHQILELDLRKQKETIELLKEGIAEVQVFFEEKNNNYTKFFLELQNKLMEFSNTIEVLADNKNDTFFKKMKKKLAEIVEFFAKMPFENPSEKRMKVKRLFKEYEIKFNLLLNKWKCFQSNVSEIKKKI